MKPERNTLDPVAGNASFKELTRLISEAYNGEEIRWMIDKHFRLNERNRMILPHSKELKAELDEHLSACSERIKAVLMEELRSTNRRLTDQDIDTITESLWALGDDPKFRKGQKWIVEDLHGKHVVIKLEKPLTLKRWKVIRPKLIHHLSLIVSDIHGPSEVDAEASPFDEDEPSVLLKTLGLLMAYKYLAGKQPTVFNRNKADNLAKDKKYRSPTSGKRLHEWYTRFMETSIRLKGRRTEVERRFKWVIDELADDKDTRKLVEKELKEYRRRSRRRKKSRH